MLNPTLLKSIRNSYNAVFFTNIGTGIIFVLIGLGCVIGSLFVTPPGPQGPLLWGGLIALAAGVINCVYYQSKRVDIVDILTQDPQQIVWIYRQVNTGKVSGVQVAQFQFIVFGLRNKQRVPVRLSAAAVDTLLAEIPAQLPHVTLGYSPEFMKVFRRDPDALFQAARQGS